MYVEWEATPWRGRASCPGIRLDYTKDTGAWDLDPRLVVRQDVDDVASHDAQGRHRHLLAAPAGPGDERRLRHPGLTDQRAIHYDIGVEHEFTRNIDASLEGFYKQLDYLVDAKGVGSVGERRHLRGRDADPLQARRALLRLDRVHAVAKPAAGRAGDAAASSPSSTRRTS